MKIFNKIKGLFSKKTNDHFVVAPDEFEKLVHKRGDIVVCENGCNVATLNSAIYRGELGYSTKLDYFEGQAVAKSGDKLPLHCKCGGVYFGFRGSEFGGKFKIKGAE
jgi:hypothetical protein